MLLDLTQHNNDKKWGVSERFTFNKIGFILCKQTISNVRNVLYFHKGSTVRKKSLIISCI